jgi:hypothetical protein
MMAGPLAIRPFSPCATSAVCITLVQHAGTCSMNMPDCGMLRSMSCECKNQNCQKILPRNTQIAPECRKSHYQFTFRNTKNCLSCRHAQKKISSLTRKIACTVEIPRNKNSPLKHEIWKSVEIYLWYFGVTIFFTVEPFYTDGTATTNVS